MTSLKEITEYSRTESARRGFRFLGIYHLLWAVHKLEPEALDNLLDAYQVEKIPFTKMLENILRPRRAGGGVPRDRQEASLAEDALARAEGLDPHPTAAHLLLVLPQLEEDPVASLCERFCLACTPPK
jgi:hypothetical protein